MRPHLQSRYDVVVIGAGMGGLTAAAVLAKAGLSVCGLEMDARPGGYLAGFERWGFRFDTAIHWLNQCGPGGLVRRVFEFLGSGAPPTAPLRRIRRYKSDSFDYLLTNDPDQLAAAFRRDFPSDRAGIEAFFALAKKLGQAMQDISRCNRSPATMNLWEKARFTLATSMSGLALLRHSLPTERGLRRYFKSQALRNVFCSEANFLSCVVPVGWAYNDDYQLPPVGGGQMFPRWLAGLL
jgi:prolycopene isomerase